MKTDIRGRIRNYTVPKENPLMAVHEAITNSFHSIYDARAKGLPAGMITIEVLREARNGNGLPYVNGFEVTDDGVGFDDENYSSFCTAESTRKERIGGKGVGRFAWLVVFRTASIDSVYRNGSGNLRRAFEFDTNLDENIAAVPTDEAERRTAVRMIGINNDYHPAMPKSIDEIAQAIVEHCAPMLLRDDAPVLVLKDGSLEIDLADYFRKLSADRAVTLDFTIGNKALKATVFRANRGEHRISFAAHGRVVTGRKLASFLPGLPPTLGSDGFVVTCFVQGDVLDETVNSNRSGFDLPTSSQAARLLNTPSLEEIARQAADIVRDALRRELAEVNDLKRAQLTEFITEYRTEYRPALGHLDGVLDRVPLGASHQKMDEVLSGYMAEVRVARRARTDKALKSLEKANTTAEQIQSLVDQVLKDVDADDRDNLAQHVATRAVVLNLFESRLGLTDEGKLSKEDALHGLIFPMRTTSDEIDPDRNHLWMIDERLAYHTFLASDRALNTTDFLENVSPIRPDINIFHTAWAFSEDVNNPHMSFSLVEFKRPERDDYTDSENPIEQVLGQIEALRAGKVRNPATKRMIEIQQGAPAYAYVVCDLTPRLKKWADMYSLRQTPDRQGFFGVNPAYNAYIEVISFTKLVNDARKRNTLLFDKLSIGSNSSNSSRNLKGH